MILVTASMQAELQNFFPGRCIPSSPRSEGELWEYHDPSGAFSAAVIGTGKALSAYRMGELLHRLSPSLVIHTGICGSASRTLRTGQVAAPRWCIQHDLALSEFSLPRGRIPYTSIDCLEISASCREEVLSCLKASSGGVQTAAEGVLASGDRFLSPEQRIKLSEFSEYAPLLAVDMESFSVALACSLRQTDLVIMKAVSDDLHHQRPKNFSRFLRRWAEIFAEAVRSYAL